ncbi:MAG TPA: 4-(cytidine 5'-diphospho)-2-C-methyl-D-erythritol kinase [Xanthomonadaceae bacterium]|nr:4-(cytidine 5'-diphospho)-2-C-methyl-D-erythritol kinase [Xanthomonadaceae bacterium]
MNAAGAADDGWSPWPAPAKLNLFLRIVGRRQDGMHELQTVFRLLDWGDCIRIRLREDARLVRTGADYPVPPDEDLVLQAARALARETGCAHGAELQVDKRVPLGGGFGGGSSDAATALVALNELWNTGLGPAQLARIGLALGADVPVFVHGRNAWAQGVGERLEPLDLPARWYLIVDPGIRVVTGELFQAPDLTRDASPLTISDFALQAGLENAFEPLLRAREPEVAAALQALSRFGHARLTGTGSGCFVEFEHERDAHAALAMLEPRWRAWTAPGAQRSPLLDAVDRWRKTRTTRTTRTTSTQWGVAKR